MGMYAQLGDKSNSNTNLKSLIQDNSMLQKDNPNHCLRPMMGDHRPDILIYEVFLWNINSLRPSDAYICVSKLTIIGSDNG